MIVRILALTLFILVGALVEPLTWGFSLNRHKLTPQPFQSFGSFPKKLYGQTWKLEAQGGQSYVFVSEDREYVIKFFKDQPRPWVPLISYRALKNKKLHRTLKGYTLLHQRCPDLSATVYLHTQATSPIPAILVDRLGIAYPVDLSAYLFVVQQKAELLTSSLVGNTKEQLLHDTTHLVRNLAAHHLVDHDPRLHLNLGRVNQKLTVIDPGKISESDAPCTLLPEKFLKFLE